VIGLKNWQAQMVFEQLALEYGVFYTLYINKELNVFHKNGHATRKSP
jgi:hypothetical protein